MTSGRRELVVSEQGVTVSCRDGSFELRTAGRLARSLRVSDVRQIILVGRVEVTHAAISAALRQDIGVIWLTIDGRFRGRLEDGDGARPDLALAQRDVLRDDARRRQLATAIVRAKVAGQRAVLLRAQRSLHDESIAEAALAMRLLQARVESAASMDAIRGFEGQAAALYWSRFGKLIARSGFAFSRRAYRPPPDAVNACLSFGYALLTSACDAATRTVGFEPSIGFLHEPQRGRPSLALDLMEEFRPTIVDRLVVRLLNLGKLRPTDFADGKSDAAGGMDVATPDDDGASVLLNERGRRVFITEFHARMRDSVRDRRTGDLRSVRDAVLEQARHLARVVVEEDPEFQPWGLP